MCSVMQKGNKRPKHSLHGYKATISHFYFILFYYVKHRNTSYFLENLNDILSDTYYNFMNLFQYIILLLSMTLD